MSDWFLFLICFKDIPVLKANCVDSDQTPSSAASDLGLHCLPNINLGVFRLKWVKLLNSYAVYRPNAVFFCCISSFHAIGNDVRTVSFYHFVSFSTYSMAKWGCAP